MLPENFLEIHKVISKNVVFRRMFIIQRKVAEINALGGQISGAEKTPSLGR